MIIFSWNIILWGFFLWTRLLFQPFSNVLRSCIISARWVYAELRSLYFVSSSNSTASCCDICLRLFRKQTSWPPWICIPSILNYGARLVSCSGWASGQAVKGSSSQYMTFLWIGILTIKLTHFLWQSFAMFLAQYNCDDTSLHQYHPLRNNLPTIYFKPTLTLKISLSVID